MSTTIPEPASMDTIRPSVSGLTKQAIAKELEEERKRAQSTSDADFDDIESIQERDSFGLLSSIC